MSKSMKKHPVSFDAAFSMASLERDIQGWLSIGLPGVFWGCVEIKRLPHKKDEGLEIQE